jgi:hypothetical protein
MEALMMRSRIIPFVATLLVAAGVNAVMATPSRSYYRTHELHSLDYRVAETLAWDICHEVGDSEKDPCKVDSSAEHRLTLLGPPEAHARLVKLLAERDTKDRSLQRFEIILLRARDGASGASPVVLPAHVSRALEGLQEILPGTRFDRVASGSLQTAGRGVIRLGGAGGAAYQVEVDYRGRRTGRGVPELLLDVTATPLKADGSADPGRTSISSSMIIFEGETVVVGSSGAGDPGEAILVLVLTSSPT